MSSSEAVTIVGSYLSPYVRKVLVCLALKEIDYVIDPIVPFFGNDEFTRISPARSVPVFIDSSITIADSTVICEYLEERYPEPALYPTAPRPRARARWLEEYADTRMSEVFIWRLFDERVIKRFVGKEEADQAIVAMAVEVQAPQVLDYLEREFSAARPFLYETMGIADITVASFMRNASIAGYSIDATRWPAMHAFVENALQHPAFANLTAYEELSLRTPLPEQREALKDAGAPISDDSYCADSPRRGVLAL
jgi:glutathione S-transferase